MLVRNRPRLTKQALDSLKGTPDVQVLVLDDRSQLETRNILLDSGVFIHRNNMPMGTGQLRNRSIQLSYDDCGRNDYLYLSDNDVFFHDGWLRTLTAIYDALWPAFQVLGAYGHPFHQAIGTPVVFADGHCVHEVTALATQSMLLRWEVWDKHGPFIETPVDRVCMSEDVDFINRVRRAGGRVGVVDPPLIVSTGITNTFGEHIPGWEIVKAQCPEGVICE